MKKPEVIFTAFLFILLLLLACFGCRPREIPPGSVAYLVATKWNEQTINYNFVDEPPLQTNKLEVRLDGLLLLQTNIPPPGSPVEPAKTPLPVEVMGIVNAKESIVLELTAAEVSAAKRLWLVVNNVQYAGKVEVRLGAQVTSCDTNVIIPGAAGAAGGIGGGHETYAMEIPLQPAAIAEGPNTITFHYRPRFAYQVNGFTLPINRVLDVTGGFRIVKLNLVGEDGKLLLPESRFTYDDPATWGPPDLVTNNLSQAIVNGLMLWSGTNPASGDRYRILDHVIDDDGRQKRISASCADCHPRTGADLAYFHFSNKSIDLRCRLHGLDATEAASVVAYIRSLPANGFAPHARPWNPPFQPGPGLDSRPAREWMGGAGWDAVANDQRQIINGIWPGAYNADGLFNASAITTNRIFGPKNYSIREVPAIYNLAQWTHWLPRMFPADSYADMIATNAAMSLAWSNSIAFLNHAHNQAALGNSGYMVSNFRSFLNYAREFRTANRTHDNHNHTSFDAQRRYAIGMWMMSKAVEFTLEYDLWETLAGELCGLQAETRTVLIAGDGPFSVSCTFSDLAETKEDGLPVEPFNGSAIGNGRPMNFMWFNSGWYHAQLVMNNGQRTSACGRNAAFPWDIPYAYAGVKNTTGYSTGERIPLMGQLALSAFEIMRAYMNSGSISNAVNLGNFSPDIDRISEIAQYDREFPLEVSWAGIEEARTPVMDALYSCWYQMALFSWPTSDYHVPRLAGQPTSYLAFVDPIYLKIRDDTAGTSEAGRQWIMLAQLAEYDVRPALRNAIIDRLYEIWPLNNDGTRAEWDQHRPL